MSDKRISDKTKAYDWHIIERELDSIYGDAISEADREKQEAETRDQDETRLRHRRRSRRKLAWQAALLALLAMAAFKYMPLFNLDEIKVVGNSYVTAEEVCRMAGVYRGQHILSVSPEDAKTLLMKDLRIERAEVKRLLPNGLMIQVTERQPVLNIPCDYGYIDIDREGLVLAAYRTPAQHQVPQLVGMKVHDLYISDSVKEQAIRDIAAFLGHIGPQAIASLSYVNISNPEHITCLTPDRTEIRLGKLDRPEEKAKICRDFLAELKLSKHPMEYIDLSFDTPFVKLRQENSAPIQFTGGNGTMTANQTAKPAQTEESKAENTAPALPKQADSQKPAAAETKQDKPAAGDKPADKAVKSEQHNPSKDKEGKANAQ
ncbi:MAG: FtsQ-type POTRA domain-containing protein [Selenomonadaceae bacterium]|nr:FtsQ-type POTRA domain-containing protein [Selenomonadaceae bacterium]